MNHNDRPRLVWLIGLIVVAGWGLLLSACRQQPAGPAPSALASPGPGEVSTVEPGTPTEPAPTALPLPSGGITLTWWTPEFFSPLIGGASGEVMAEQIVGFVAMNPDIGVQPILKAAQGRGGILDFLRTASVAAPAVVPDVVTLDTLDLPAAVQYKLLQPLGELVSAELRDDLFPFAIKVGQFDRQWYAVQVEADLQHLVYRRDSLRQPPRTWEELLRGRVTYIFPAGGRDGLLSDASLVHYLGAGGSIDEINRTMSLAEEPLRALLSFYRQGTERRVIPFEVLTYDSMDACWAAFVAGQADMTHALASRYLLELEALAGYGFAAVPTRDGKMVTISSGWALAITAKDPAHQAAAAQFVEWLLDPANNAAWTKAAGRLPTRRSALAAWDIEDDYADSLGSALEAATFRPGGADSAQISRWLHQAVRDVLTGVASPEDAARQAVEAAGS